MEDDLNEYLLKSEEWFKRLVETVRDYAKKYKESENWLSTTLRSIGDAVIATDRVGNIRFVNPIAEVITGFTQEESIGKPLETIFNIVNEETRELVENPVTRVIREGTVVGLANHTVLIAKDGKEIPLADSGAPIKDNKGNIIGVVVIFRDNTERRKAEQVLRESEHRLGERVKELTFLYGLSKLFENADKSYEAILRETLDLIPLAWQFPEITCARINFESKEFKTSNFKETEWKLSTSINIQEKDMIIEVYYLEDKIFLKEEKYLLTDLANRLKSAIEQRVIQQKLKVSENWLSTTLRSIGDALIATDGFGNIRFINPIAEDLTGFTLEESIGKPLEAIFNIINEETHESVENPATRVIREEKVIGLANHTVLIAKDGKEIPIADSGAPIKDDKGNVIGVVLIFRDITERRKAEQIAIKIVAIVENSDDAIIGKTLDGTITNWNKGAERIYGYTAKEIIGQSISIIIPTDKRVDMYDILKQIKQGKKIDHFETLRLQKDGMPLEMSLNVSPIKNASGKIIGASTIARDITEHKKMEQKLKESEKKYYEAYNRAEFYKDLFTHDINNILQNMLTGIQLSEELLGDPEKLEKIKRYNSIIKDQIKRGVKLVSNIRKLSKLENEEIGIKEIEILGILEKSITNVEIAYQDRNIDIKVDSIGKKLYCQVNELLEDLFENILINAIKHNKNPTVEILVKISKEKITSINYLKMEFIDNGIGIDDSRKKVVFQREASETTSTKGMGIGLSLVKKIVDTFNGKIWVEDRVKGDHTKGSNFIIMLPEVVRNG